MTALLFEKRFVQPILDGIKRHTIRRVRKRPIKVGESLSLRHWEGLPYRSMQVEFARVSAELILPIEITNKCVTIGGNAIKSQHKLDAFAKSDGFDDWAHLLLYRDFKYGLPFSGCITYWDGKYVESSAANSAPPASFRD